MHQLFGSEKGIFKKITERINTVRHWHTHRTISLEVENAVRNSMLLLLLEHVAYPPIKNLQLGDSPAQDKIELLVQCFGPDLMRDYIIQRQSVGYLLYCANLFANRINEAELRLWK